MTPYMMENGYVNTLIQKRGIPCFTGCLEHRGVLGQMTHEARSKKSNLTVVWLDFVDIPHNLVRIAIKYYHVPDRIKGMICSYLRGIKLRFKTTNCITQWQHHEKTIVTGCAVSPSLSSCYEPHEKCNQRLGEELKHLITVIKDFVDDLIITTSSHVQAKLVLTKLDEVATQTTMTKGQQQQHPQY